MDTAFAEFSIDFDVYHSLKYMLWFEVEIG